MVSLVHYVPLLTALQPDSCAEEMRVSRGALSETWSAYGREINRKGFGPSFPLMLPEPLEELLCHQFSSCQRPPRWGGPAMHACCWRLLSRAVPRNEAPCLSFSPIHCDMQSLLCWTKCSLNWLKACDSVQVRITSLH